MKSFIQIDSELLKQIKIKSEKLGIKSDDLIHSYILKGLKDDDKDKQGLFKWNDDEEILDLDSCFIEIVPKKDPLTIEEIRELVGTNHNPKSKVGFSELLDL